MSAEELRAFLDHYVRCLNERRVDDLALIGADEITRNGERMTRQQWWDGPVGQHQAAVPAQVWVIEDAVIAGDGSRCATGPPTRLYAAGSGLNPPARASASASTSSTR